MCDKNRKQIKGLVKYIKLKESIRTSGGNKWEKTSS